MNYEIREATAADTAQLAELSHESFGYPVAEHPHPDPSGNGRRTWVATQDERVIASVVAKDYRSWWWGEQLPTCGLAGVKVAAEHRGQGLMRTLCERALRRAQDDGALISTLFPTAPGIYRSLGYELVGAYDDQSVIVTSAFAGIRPGAARLRRATPADLPVMRDVYDQWACAQNGPLVRRGACFPDGDEAFGTARVTLALDARDDVRGVLVWDRSGGYGGPDSRLEVLDFVALDEDAARSLLAMIGSQAVVAPQSVWSTSGTDLVQLLSPQWAWQVRRSYPYMLNVLDVPAVLSARRYPDFIQAATTFCVADRCWTMTLAQGRAELSPSTATPRIRFSRRGFALVWSGAQSVANVRSAGLLTGDDELFGSLFGGRDLHIRDYF